MTLSKQKGMILSHEIINAWIVPVYGGENM